jgi:hypothetical protein
MRIFPDGAGFRGRDEAGDPDRAAEVLDTPSHGILFQMPCRQSLVSDDDVRGQYARAKSSPSIVGCQRLKTGATSRYRRGCCLSGIVFRNKVLRAFMLSGTLLVSPDGFHARDAAGAIHHRVHDAPRFTDG